MGTPRGAPAPARPARLPRLRPRGHHGRRASCGGRRVPRCEPRGPPPREGTCPPRVRLSGVSRDPARLPRGPRPERLRPRGSGGARGRAKGRAAGAGRSAPRGRADRRRVAPLRGPRARRHARGPRSADRRPEPDVRPGGGVPAPGDAALSLPPAGAVSTASFQVGPAPGALLADEAVPPVPVAPTVRQRVRRADRRRTGPRCLAELADRGRPSGTGGRAAGEVVRRAGHRRVERRGARGRLERRSTPPRRRVVPVRRAAPGPGGVPASSSRPSPRA